MQIYGAREIRDKLHKLIDYVADAHTHVYIKGKKNKAVILSEEDFRNMQETIYLLSIPGMRESIIAAKKEKITKCAKNLDW